MFGVVISKTATCRFWKDRYTDTEKLSLVIPLPKSLCDCLWQSLRDLDNTNMFGTLTINFHYFLLKEMCNFQYFPIYSLLDMSFTSSWPIPTMIPYTNAVNGVLKKYIHDFAVHYMFIWYCDPYYLAISKLQVIITHKY